MFKVGDKLLCNKYFNANIHMTFIKDVEYSILETYPGQILIGTNRVDIWPHWFLIEDIDKYFNTIKIIRKMKLERLKNIIETK